jgi:hypothetical protein
MSCNVRPRANSSVPMVKRTKMMSRYFLHLCEPSTSIFDSEGIEVEDDQAAIARAIWTIRDVIANDILAGMPVLLANYISIRNEDGSEVQRVFFRDAVRFVEPSPTETPPSDVIKATPHPGVQR